MSAIHLGVAPLLETLSCWKRGGRVLKQDRAWRNDSLGELLGSKFLWLRLRSGVLRGLRRLR